MVSRALVFDLIFRDKGSGLVFDKATRGLNKLQQAGKRMEGTGRTLTRGLTLPIIGVGVASAKLASDFQASMSKITGLVGVSQDQVAKWSDQVLDLSKTLPQSPKELADALFFVTSAGLRGQAAMDALKVSAKGAAAGLGDTQTVADAVTSAMNAYGQANLSAAKAGDILVATVREGKAEASALAPVFGRILPLAAEMGVKFNDVGASLAAMTRIGMDADEAATSVQAILSGLIKPSTQGAKALAGVGLSYASIRGEIREKGLLAALMDVRGAFHGDQEEIAKVIPNVRALRGFMALTGSQAKETKGIFDRMADSTGSLDAAFKAASQTSKFKFKSALSSLQAAGIKIGSQLLPVFVDVAETGARMADAIAELPAPARTALIAFGGLVATLGPLLIIAGKLVQSYAAVRKAIVGTNAVLGVNKTQTAAAAVETTELSAAENAAATSSTRLAAGLKALQFASIITAAAFVAFKDAQNTWNQRAGKSDSLLTKIRKGAESSIPPIGALSSRWEHHATAIKKSGDQTRVKAIEDAYAAQQQEKLRQEMVASLPQFQNAADKARINAEAIKGLSGKLDEARSQYAALKQPIHDAILGFDGLISKSKVTAKEVIASLHDQVANFRTYARDSQRLLRAGVDPAAIEELSKKGPQFVHALATGSNAQLRLYKQYWHDRQAEIKGSFEKSMAKQYEGLVKKIRQMQHEINTLRGKNVGINAKFGFQGLEVFRTKSGRAMFAAGGRVTQGTTSTADDVLARLSRGEFVVNAKAAQAVGYDRLEALNAMRFARGGRVGKSPLHAAFAEFGRDIDGILDLAVKAFRNTLLAGGGPAPASRNEAIVRLVSASMFGWVGAQWRALRGLLMGESGFRNTAQNPTSTAYGIYQFLNSTWATVGGRKTSDPRLQAVFGDRYIARGYHDPIHAYGAWLSRSPHWYDHGGMLPPGLSLAYNGTGRPEPVGTTRVVWEVRTGGAPMDQLIAQLIKKYVRVVGGGDVQKALGR